MYEGGVILRNKYPEKTVQKILDVATELFTKKGYEDTSINDITDKIEMSKGAIYHHFRNKEAIFEAVCKRLVESKLPDFAKIKNSNMMNGREKLLALLSIDIFPRGLLNSYCKIPKMFIYQIQYIYEKIIPQFVTPIIYEGSSDGTIEVEFSKEIAEAFIILNCIWICQPMYLNEQNSLENRYLAYHFMLQHISETLKH